LLIALATLGGGVAFRVPRIRDLSVKIDHQKCEFTNTVHSSATPELRDFVGKQGIPWEVFQAARKPISQAHNRQETPLFAKSIERHALKRKFLHENRRSADEENEYDRVHC